MSTEADVAALDTYFTAIDRGICPTHGTPITLRQVGRCVYALPCGCRLYVGTIPTTPVFGQPETGKAPTATPICFQPPAATSEDERALRALAACTLLPGGWDKRFIRGVQEHTGAGRALTASQRTWIWTLARRYRRQIRDLAVLRAVASLRPAATATSDEPPQGVTQ